MKTLIVKTPLKHDEARKYAISIIFEDFLGLTVDIYQHEGPEYIINNPGSDGILVLPDIFFASIKNLLIDREAVPTNSSFRNFDIRSMRNQPKTVDSDVPILFGANDCLIHEENNHCRLPIDIIGTTFFMLTCYEQAVNSTRDQHDRFPSVASIAARAGILHRPIVDECIEILWSALSQLWPRLERKIHHPFTFITCDVDVPYQKHLRKTLSSLRVALGDLVKRHSVSSALKTMRSHLRVRSGKIEEDVYYDAIRCIMDLNERNGHPVTFFFIAEASNDRYDMGYCLDDDVLRKIITQIRDRGHSVGLHPSYNSHDSQQRISHEFSVLLKAMKDANIHQNEVGSRQHYLRWNINTPRYLERAGLNYDSTLSFPDKSGFRTGTSHEFRMYDLTENRPLSVRQRPLIAAESIVVDEIYMGMGLTSVAADHFAELRRRCYMFGGNFTLLWHNSSLVSEHERRFYEELLAYA